MRERVGWRCAGDQAAVKVGHHEHCGLIWNGPQARDDAPAPRERQAEWDADHRARQAEQRCLAGKQGQDLPSRGTEREQDADLMPPLGRYELALEVLDGLKR